MALLHRANLQSLTGELDPFSEGLTGADPVARLIPIPDGAAGIAATLDKMVEWTKQYRTDLTIRKLAEAIISAVPGKSFLEEIEAVRDWVRNNIRYTEDINDVETLRTPIALIFNPFGDCDDQALLVGTLLESIGKRVHYVAIGNTPGDYNHVYAEVKYNNRWISVETTEPVPIGWEPINVWSRMVRHT